MTDGSAPPRKGAGRPRIDGTEKVSGQAAYAGDIHIPGQLSAAILRCPHPHARIRRLDTKRAAALDGVHAIMTHADTSGYEWFDEKVPLFGTTLRFAGDEVAAVAAETAELARDALALIEVEYEILPFAPDLDAALRAGAPRIHEQCEGNIKGEPDEYSRGDVAAGFEAADIVIERTFTTQTALHNALEPHGCTAHWHDDLLHIWVSTQGIRAVREGIAERLGIPEERVRVLSPFIGGGFGAKQVDWKQTLIAALLARRTGRPVQLMLDRHAENLAAGNRNPTVQRLRIGARKDGTLCAIEAHVDRAIGAYAAEGEGSDVAGLYQLLYHCPNVHTTQRSVYTNTGPSVAFRGPGFTEAAFALEQAMDELAVRLGIDPFELRKRNHAEKNQKKDLPYSSPDALRACMQEAREAFRSSTVREIDSARRRGPTKQRGVGLAVCVWHGGSPNPPARVKVRLYRHGIVEVLTGSQDIGTGTRTVVAQLAAEALGCPLELVRVRLGDTNNDLAAPTSAGSMTVATLAPAVRRAALDARERLVRELDSGAAGLSHTPFDPATLRQLGTRYVEGTGTCDDPPEDVSIATFAAQIAEVEVDRRTGEVTVRRVVCATDCGTVVNRLLADNQVYGGVVQGIGYALSEERVLDRGTGLVINANLEDYLVPTAADCPRIVHVPLDRPDTAANPLGAKGLGEPPLIATAAAIANAVHDATGVRIRTLPITRARLLEGLRDAADGRAA